jgi:hypothetical protein
MTMVKGWMGLALWTGLVLGGAPALSQPEARNDALTLRPEQLAFHYQESVDPWRRFACKHEKADVGVYEWDAYCKIDGVVHRYGVHLVLSYYPRTVYGHGAYEILYWVTDRTVRDEWTGHSSTIWIHLDDEKSRARVIELAQGVENDLAALGLTIDLRK